MRQLDLFAGIGGISLAAEWAGIETVALCEKEPFAQSILRKRFPGRPIYSNIFDLTREVLEHDGITGIDIVAGGFPCQPFSHAGKRTGTADDRYLWPQMLRVIDECRPTWVFAENVDGLVSMAKSGGDIILEDEATICEEAEMVIETIRQDLKAIGYQSVPVVIPACGVGASHRRYRIFILGYSECSGRERYTRGRSGSQPSDGYSGSEAGFMADTESGRRGSWRTEQSGQQGELCSFGSGTPCEPSANTESERFEQAREYIERSEEWIAGGSIVADSEYGVLEGSRWPRKSIYSTQDGYGQTSGSINDGARSTESGMGRGPYELSDWLDGWGMNPLDALVNFIAAYPQPALMGQEQHNWEPPRVATGVKNRAARLKALGNAVDPLQALPVLYGIRVLHEQMRRNSIDQNQQARN